MMATKVLALIIMCLIIVSVFGCLIILFAIFVSMLDFDYDTNQLSINYYCTREDEDMEREPHVIKLFKQYGNGDYIHFSQEPYCSECMEELYDEEQKYCQNCGARLSGEIEIGNNMTLYIDGKKVT